MSVSCKSLQQLLGVSRQKLTALVRRGMPREGCGGFEPAAVAEWLALHEPGLAAKLQPPEKIARTYAELARELGMGGSDPERILARLATRADFPGRPGTAGKRNAHLPVERIRTWMASVTSTVVEVTDSELEAINRRILYLDLEERERGKRLALEELADVSEVAQFAEQVIANAKAILGAVEDEVVALLPENTPAEVRTSVHRKVRGMRDSALAELARLIEGDTDETGDPDDGDAFGNRSTAAASGESLPAA